VAKHNFQIADKDLHVTCSVGLATAPSSDPNLDTLVQEAMDAAQRTAERGGNQVLVSEQVDHDTRVLAYDQVWVKHIKAALADNRFHLVQQPIASLNGDAQKVYDVAVRMLDLQGREVLPSEFLPAAERNDLMKSIDRWVLGAALAFAAKRQPDLLFVRLSKDSLVDTTLKNSLAEPQRLCLQVTEDVAARHLQPTQRLLAELRKRRVRLALEHFGTGRDSQGLLSALPLDFLKIDGSLMQGLSGNPEMQERVRLIVDAARKRSIQTVAERIEDANTMAVVWQLGVQYIQGYLVHAPEEVVLKS
jgi:EAL domain-containing protein (putative c-di-GMP-specific phosphodiesterase class I)